MRSARTNLGATGASRHWMSREMIRYRLNAPTIQPEAASSQLSPSCELGGARQPNVHASAETLRTLLQERSRGPFSAKQGSDVGQGEKGRLRK